jgi:hypothetical protein
MQQNGVILGDSDLLDTAQVGELDLLQLVAEVLTDHFTPCRMMPVQVITQPGSNQHHFHPALSQAQVPVIESIKAATTSTQQQDKTQATASTQHALAAQPP